MFLTRPPSLRALAAFEAAARHENFGLAAAELHLTESAISHAVRRLEAQVGTALFQRAGRSVVLTPDGRDLADRIRAVLQLLGHAFARVRPSLREARPQNPVTAHEG